MGMLQDTILSEIRRAFRIGFYVADVKKAATNAVRSSSIFTDWDTTMEHVGRVSSPLLDVIPAVGTKVAILSRDGVPSRAAILGAFVATGETVSSFTAWIRANLEQKPGQVEIGAESGIRITIRNNDGDLETIEAQSIWIEADKVVLKSGDIRLGSDGVTKRVALAEDVEAELASIRADVASHTHAVPAAGLLDSTTKACTGAAVASIPVFSTIVGNTGASKVKAE